MPSESPEEARRRINEELLELKRHSLRLKTEWNTYAPISKIPDEILIQIFEVAQKVIRFRAWYQLLGVCSHWQNVAVGTPALWQTPPTHKHELMLLMLERSKDASLDVCVHAYTSFTTVTHLFNHIRRIRALTIRQEMSSLCRTRDFLLELRQELLRLEELYICQTNETDLPVIPSTPFRRSRTVHTITLAQINFDWNMFPFPNLINLFLSNNRHTAQISADQLILTLAQMPHLEHIRLDTTSILLRDPPVAGNSIPDLPCLLSLEIWEVIPSLAQYLMSNISLPVLQNISISCHQTPDRAYDNCRGVVQAVSSIMINGNFGLLESLALDESHFGFGLDSSTLGGLTVAEFAIEIDDPGHNTSAVIADTIIHSKSMCSILRRLPRLILGFEFRLDVCQLLPLCDIMTSVETITVSEGPFSTLMKAFEARQPPDMLFPKLKTIQLENYDFTDNADPEILQRLCDILIERREYGVPVQEYH